ncbi:hypothetical protein [Candidatus Viridilinea mediisalina]|uniref:Uncharacterized protein n=1 Tax=Candidatus Viridilinea mediisalina TaxID=2024553 RepID=A0A2A6RLX1_9CHLR|nr:hypothetical protein [Candidatus Viridilinea mediisalina]PDW03906.1 hypothetical protein CJ255_06545 [Candidatus Viridilinea mediisalina]
MTTIYVETDDNAHQVRSLIEIAIQREIAHLELALTLAQRRLIPFEQKYGTTSDYFMTSMAAEDLAGGDDEYVQWAGEYCLVRDLEAKLQQLRGITYRD